MLRPALTLLVILPLFGCAPVSSLSDRDGGAPNLSESERTIVREQVAKARDDERWTAAWNQEVEAGADRGRLETIALDALDRESQHEAQKMFEELMAKWDALTPEGRARATGLVEKAIVARDWTKAVSVEIATAEDVPEYTRAFEVYRDAPAHRAPELLKHIQEAREDALDASK